MSVSQVMEAGARVAQTLHRGILQPLPRIAEASTPEALSNLRVATVYVSENTTGVRRVGEYSLDRVAQSTSLRRLTGNIASQATDSTHGQGWQGQVVNETKTMSFPLTIVKDGFQPVPSSTAGLASYEDAIAAAVHRVLRENRAMAVLQAADGSRATAPLKFESSAPRAFSGLSDSKEYFQKVELAGQNGRYFEGFPNLDLTPTHLETGRNIDVEYQPGIEGLEAIVGRDGVIPFRS